MHNKPGRMTVQSVDVNLSDTSKPLVVSSVERSTDDALDIVRREHGSTSSSKPGTVDPAVVSHSRNAAEDRTYETGDSDKDDGQNSANGESSFVDRDARETSAGWRECRTCFLRSPRLLRPPLR